MNLICYNLAGLIASGSFCVGVFGMFNTYSRVYTWPQFNLLLCNICDLFCYLISLVNVSRTMWKKGVRKPPFHACFTRGKGPGSGAGFEPFLDLRGSFLVLVCREFNQECSLNFAKCLSKSIEMILHF